MSDPTPYAKRSPLEHERDTGDGFDTVEFLASSCRDIVTGEPLDNDARPDLYVCDVRTIADEYAAMRDRIDADVKLIVSLLASSEAAEARIAELEAERDAAVGAALAEAADCAYNLKREDWASENEDWDAGTHDAAVAITALNPTALTALDRAKREARVEGMQAAAEIAEAHKPSPFLSNSQPNGYWRGVDENSHSIAIAISILIAAERGKAGI